MRLTVTLANRKETRKTIQRYAQRIGQATEDAVEDIGVAVAEQAKELILSGPKTGVVYRRENPARVHQASAWGEAPADDLGRLRNSIAVRYIKINQYAYASVVGTPLDYGLELEKFGPNHNGQTRPFLRPAVLEVEARVGGILAGAWDKNKL